MKNLIKFSSVALALLAMTSCSSDDLDFAGNFDGKITDSSELVGVLEQSGITRTGMVNVNGYPVVWSKNDEVNVYSLSEALTFATYKLKDGYEGTGEGTFEVVYQDGIDLDTNKDLYAVTNSPWVYGLSATQVDEDTQLPLLTTKIPTNFAWAEDRAVDYADKKYYTNDAPYWGAVSGTNEAGQMKVSFRKTVGAIKLDAALLPKGTKAVVIASKNPKQPLSGTFNTVLDVTKADKDNALKPNEELVNYNLIRADFTAVTGNVGTDVNVNNKIFIFPLVCGHYDELDIIAIINDEQGEGTLMFNNFDRSDDNVQIPAAGTVVNRGLEGTDWVRIRKYTDKDVTPDDVIAVYPAVEQVLEDMTPMQISEKIALAYDDMHDFIFTIKNMKLNDDYVVVGTNIQLANDNTIYIPKNVHNAARTAEIVLNFDETLENTMKTGETVKYNTLYIKEANYNGKPLVTNTVLESADTRGGLIGTYGSGTNTNAYATESAAGISKKTDLSGQYERKVVINLTSPAIPNHAMNMDIYLPTSRVTLGNYKNSKKYGAIGGNNTEYGKITVVAEGTNDISNTGKTAGLNIKGNFDYVDVLPTHAGGVIVKGTDVTEKNVTVENLVINNTKSGLVKIDDASVNTIEYKGVQTLNQYIYTVGSAAIKTVKDESDMIRIRAFWTGKTLLNEQVADGYDQETIYTAAQLASMGMSKAVTEYNVSDQITAMHLGGSEYPWKGATIKDLETFTLNGNGVGLRSMKLTDAENKVVSHGLINSISVSGDVTVNDIDLYEAKTTKASAALGAVVGSINTNGKVTFGGNQFSVRQINFTGAVNQAGGIVGLVSAGDVTFGAKEFILDINTIAGENNVGGFAGMVESKGTVTLPGATEVTLTAGDIIGTGKNVGGVFGTVSATNTYNTWSTLNLEANSVKAGISNAGGIVGFYTVNGEYASFGGSKSGKGINVKVGEISAPGRLSTDGKIEGNVGGIAGNADKGRFSVATYAPVTVTVDEMASACHVGGLVGLCNTPAVLNGAEEHEVTVTIAALKNTVADPANYKSTEQYNALGTFGGLVGKANQGLTIANKEYNTVVDAETLFSKDTRIALYFNKRESEEVNVNGVKRAYWGDMNNNVGYAVEGYNYVIGGKKQNVNTDYNQYVDYSTVK